MPMHAQGALRRTLPRLCLVAVAAAGLAACGGGDPGATAPAATATILAPTSRIETLPINSTADAGAPSQTVAFGGTTFGRVGTYTKIIGTATGALDPNDPKKAVIVDLAL